MPVEEVVPPPVPPGPKIDELVVSAEGASKLTVRCNGMSASGSASATLKAFPAGFCTIEAKFGEETHRMGMTVEQVQNVACALQEGVLRCS
jgi:hypothetical protein